jgi:hypothetical protein
MSVPLPLPLPQPASATAMTAHVSAESAATQPIRARFLLRDAPDPTCLAFHAIPFLRRMFPVAAMFPPCARPPSQAQASLPDASATADGSIALPSLAPGVLRWTPPSASFPCRGGNFSGPSWHLSMEGIRGGPGSTWRQADRAGPGGSSGRPEGLWGHTAVIELLIAHGADVSTKDQRDGGILAYDVGPEVADLLREHRASEQAGGLDGRSRYGSARRGS